MQYTVTFREWMYQEKEIIVQARSKDEALEKARDEIDCPSDINEHAEWYASEFKTLKPRIKKFRK